MGYASKAGRARTSSRNPQAHAICDRCGFRYNHVDLRWQLGWAGAAVVNKRILVCARCEDDMQQQLRAIVLPADPVPIHNARPQLFYVAAQTNARQVSGYNTTDPKTGIAVPGGDLRSTQDGSTRVEQQTGGAPGSLNQTPGIDPNAPGANDPGLPYENTEPPETGPLE